MKICDILNGVYTNVSIVVPNPIEKKLLLHRFSYCKCNISDNTITSDDTIIRIFTPDELSQFWEYINTSTCFIEFPEMVPDNIVSKLQMSVDNLNCIGEII